MKHTWILFWRQLCFCRMWKLVLCEILVKIPSPYFSITLLLCLVLWHQDLQNTMPGRKMYTTHIFQVKKKKKQGSEWLCGLLRSQRKWKNWDLNESLRTLNLGLSLLLQRLTVKDSKSSSVKTQTFHYRRLITK